MLAPVALLGGALLAGCGGGASATGQLACAEVQRSLTLYHRSQNESGAVAAADARRALTALRQAEHQAALIGSAGGTWQALAATLQESDRVPEADLVHALQAQCSALTTSGN